MNRRGAYGLIALEAYPAWIAMMAAHEAGHVLHGLCSGGRIKRVSLPLLHFSRTDLAANPHPLLVAWGGPIWGCLLPLAILGCALLAQRGVNAARLFAGFCLVSNGAYIACGPMMTAGDGRDLIRHGAPAWSLVAFGAIALLAGMTLWHLAGRTRSVSTADPHKIRP